jgi:hypothetical protein
MPKASATAASGQKARRAKRLGPGERVAILSRTTLEMRKRLDDAAAASGRSLAQEIELRLEQSFRPPIAEEYAGSRYAVKLIEVVVIACRLAEGMTGYSVDDNRETFKLAVQLAHQVFGTLEKLDPNPDAFASPQAKADIIKAGAELTLATRFEPDRDRVHQLKTAFFSQYDAARDHKPPVEKLQSAAERL